MWADGTIICIGRTGDATTVSARATFGGEIDWHIGGAIDSFARAGLRAAVPGT